LQHKVDNNKTSFTMLQKAKLISRFFFFFQAEDGIRYFHVTGVQTCALPISSAGGGTLVRSGFVPLYYQLQEILKEQIESGTWGQIGRASCRERETNQLVASGF